MTTFLLTIPLIAAAPVPKDFKRDAAKLDGAWRLTDIDYHGRRIELVRESVWRFDAGSATITFADDTDAPTRELIRVDPNAKPMGFRFTKNADQLGVFEISGDTLTICISHRPRVPPADTAGGESVVKYTFQRVGHK